MDYVVGTALALALMGIRVVFFDSLLKRRSGRLLFWGSVIIISILSIAGGFLLAQWYLSSIVISVLAGILLAKVLYEASLLRSIFVSILFVAAASLFDITSSYILVSMTGRTLSELRTGVSSFLIGAGISHITILFVTLVIRKVLNIKTLKQPLKHTEILRLLVFPVVSAFVLTTMFNIATINDDLSLMVFTSVIGLLAANLALIFIFDRLEREYKIREENELLQQQIHLESNNVRALMEYQNAQRQMAHDHSNHLNTIGVLIENKDFAEAKTYIGKLVDKCEHTQYVIRTNNPVADAILNLKYLLAKRDNIQMTVKTNDLSQFPLQSEELSTVLTNVLDNAIEACTKVKGISEIVVKIIYAPSESLISIRNTTACPVLIQNNHVQTTKTSSDNHGFGLKNVKSVLTRHNYEYALGYDNGWFQFTAVF